MRNRQKLKNKKTNEFRIKYNMRECLKEEVE